MRLFYRDSAEMSGTALDPRIRETHACRRKNRIKQKVVADMTAAAGMVTSHAHTIRVATPQRTADNRLTAPTPTMAPVMVCVVLTGIPARAVANRVMAPALSAQKPPTGFSFVIFRSDSTHANDGPGYGVRCAHRNSRQGSREQSDGSGTLRAKTANRFQLRDLQIGQHPRQRWPRLWCALCSPEFPPGQSRTE